MCQCDVSPSQCLHRSWLPRTPGNICELTHLDARPSQEVCLGYGRGGHSVVQSGPDAAVISQGEVVQGCAGKAVNACGRHQVRCLLVSYKSAPIASRYTMSAWQRTACSRSRLVHARVFGMACNKNPNNNTPHTPISLPRKIPAHKRSAQEHPFYDEHAVKSLQKVSRQHQQQQPPP